ncbi:MAG: 30S ribosomal protein S8 [Candidatus Pacearchaeota archaeon]
MKRDIIAKALNEIMNAKRAGKRICIVQPTSKLLIEIFDIMKSKGYIEYEIEKNKFNTLKVELKKLNECGVIKPRFNVKIKDVDKYVRRYLPARDMGIIIISTNKGLTTDKEELKAGGCLIAYCY